MSRKIVVLGSGFLGINAALDLYNNGEKVVVVDKNTKHEYIPSTIDLIRSRFSKEELEIDLEEFLPEEIEFKQAEVENIRMQEKTVETRHGLIGYDKLVVGLGGAPADFGMKISTADHVWSLESAQDLSRKAENAENALIIGAGYVGVETAGELAEKGIDVTMIEANTRPMQYLDEKSSEKILEILHSKDIRFRGGKTVSKVQNGNVEFENGENQEADLIIWSAGVQASKTVQKVFETNSQGVEVNQGLSVVGNKDIFVGGDSAAIEGQKTAHKAIQQGETIAENISSDTNPLKQVESKQDFLLVSIGDTAGLVFRNKLVLSSEFLRPFKDLVKKYYFARLQLKKRFNVSFLP